MSRFVQPDFKMEIYKNVISATFPNLIDTHKNILLKYLTRLLDVVAYSIFFEDILNSEEDKLRNQLRQNNYRDVLGFMFMLLPYTDDTSDTTKLESFDQLYTAKKDKSDPKNKEPKYIYSNVQYGMIDPFNFTEKNWEESHMRATYCMLVDTIRMVSYKLSPNWINIIPDFISTDNNERFRYYTRNNKK